MNANSKLVTSVLASIVLASIGSAADWPQWRGPTRDGISREAGLLQEWPASGPKLLWRAEDLGAGFSTPSIVGGRLYVLGSTGTELEFVEARDATSGKRIWSKRIGKVGKPNQKPSYPGARSTPTIEGDSLYALGSDGDLVRMALDSGEIRWKKNIRDAEFGGKQGTWAYAESPLVDGNAVVCTPGGGKATLAAFDKSSGNVLWTCAIPEGDEAAYASVIPLEIGGVRQYVQLLQKGLVGVEAKSGKLLWRYGKPVSRFNANIPTPLAGGDVVYVGSAGTGGGAVKLHVAEGAVQAKELYFESRLPTAIGGTVRIGDYLYGTTSKAMMCLEFATGTVKWQERVPSAASICFADGRLYLHGENGDLALLEATPEGFREKGRFTPPGQPKREGGAKAWAHPVVSNGRLFVRDVNVLWCFDVRKPKD